MDKTNLKLFGLVLTTPALLLLWIYTRLNIVLILLGALILFGMLINVLTMGLFLFIRRLSSPYDYTEYMLHLKSLQAAINTRLMFILYPITIGTYCGLFYYEQYLLFGLGCAGLITGQVTRIHLANTISFLEGKKEL